MGNQKRERSMRTNEFGWSCSGQRLAYLREGRRDAEGEVVQNLTSELL